MVNLPSAGLRARVALDSHGFRTTHSLGQNFLLDDALLSHLLDGWVYAAIPAWLTPKNYPAAYLSLTIPIYLISLLAGKLLHAAVAACTKSGKRGEIRFSRQIP